MNPKFNQNCKSFRIFKNAITKSGTLNSYTKGLDHLMRFHRLKSYDYLAELDKDPLEELLEDWVIAQKTAGLKRNTIVGRLNGVELFLEMNKRVWHRKIVRKLLPADDEPVGGDVPFTTDELYKMKLACKKPRDHAILEFLGCTGVRPGSIEDPVLRIKHLVDMPHPVHVHTIPKWCYAVKVYDESKEGYWGFLVPEARQALDSYFASRRRNGEKITPESPIFLNYENEPFTRNQHMSVYSVRRFLERLINTAGIERTKIGARYDKALVYGFRKRFNGILKMNNSINSNIAEKLMAHRNGLDGHYLKPTREECYNEFVKAILDLTIDPTERQKIKIQDLEKQNSKLESMYKDALASLGDRVMSLERERDVLKSQKLALP